jgi:hypothetical protein
MIVIIDGWWGSGKGTLKGLLDGHSKVFVSSVQESIVGGLSNVEDLELIFNEKDVIRLRKAIACKTEYYRIERDSLKNKLLNSSIGSNFIYNIFNMDFYDFEKIFWNLLINQYNWSLDIILELLYKVFSKIWIEYPGNREDFTHYITMDNNYNNTFDFVLLNSSNIKLIWVDRSTEGILATLCSRKPIKGILDTASWSRGLVDYIEDGTINLIEKKRKQIRILEEKYPDRIMIVSFEKLISDLKSTMQNVTFFINLDFEDILLDYTYCGNSFEGSEKFTQQILDTPEKVFSIKELDLIKEAIIKSHIPPKISITRKIINILHIKKILKYLINKLLK